MKLINPQKKADELVSFIQKSCQKEKIADVLIGVSGGVDSATSLTLAVKAMGREHVYPLLLPYGSLNGQGSKDAWTIIDRLKIPHNQVQVIDIKPLVDTVTSYDTTIDDGRKGNIMARMRMIVLFDLAKKHYYFVVGTENRSEHLLGYYTRFGDEASDIEPLRNLYKYQVYEVAKYLKVPKEILSKSPTAGLWENQTDEGEFGFSYKTADEILYLHTEKKLTKKQIIDRGFDKKSVENVWWWIEKGSLKDRLPYKK
jgi:NAD+ synthase